MLMTELPPAAGAGAGGGVGTRGRAPGFGLVPGHAMAPPPPPSQLSSRAGPAISPTAPEDALGASLMEINLGGGST